MALTGSNNEQKIWNYFISKGFNEYGCAGLIGNLYAESGLSSTNLQNSYENKLGYTDTSYTSAVDKGSYTNFVKDSAGYGLAQWTFWSRKQALLEYAKSVNKSIGDLEMQLDFLYKEISGYTSVINILKNAKSILEASNAVLLNYERPADQSVSVQNKRASYGQTYYDKYANGSKKETNSGGGNMGYTNSSLVDCKVMSPNHSGTRTHKIDRITPHCVVGQLTAESIGGCFSKTSNEASCNYGIGKDGRVCLVVDEKNRSWCSSSNENDQRAVTIECASDATEPYTFNTAVYNKLVKLCIDICKRNGLTKVFWFNDKNKSLSYEPKTGECVLTVHRWFANKSCPGTWMYSRMGQLADEINKGLGNNTSTASSSNSQPQANTSGVALKYAVGDIVDFTGSTHYTSSSSASGSACKPGVAKVTAVSKGSKHPYHLIRESNGGSTVYGWVDENSISGKHLSSSNNKSTSTPSVTEVVAGTKLTLNNVNLYSSSSSKTKASTKTGTYYVWSKDLVNGKIRITNSSANVGKNGQVTGWINYEDAKKAAGITSNSTSSSSFKAYTVKVNTDALNIRKGAGTNYAVVGSIKDKGVYTIVEEAKGTGTTKWGRLKSGAGWICLDYCKKL